MPDPLLCPPSIALPQPPLLYLPLQKFQLGDWVYWKNGHDLGHITGVCWATESSVKAVGFHYLVLLDPTSPSKQIGIDLDFAFQDDLALVIPTRSPA